MFDGILEDTLTVSTVTILVVVAIILGMVIAVVHMKTSSYSKNFVITLAILPLLVEVVMLMVNGNLGTSVAVLGAFSLIRFRSLPGNSREIASIFLAMAIGLSLGMGQVYFAILITIVVSLLFLVFYTTKFGDPDMKERLLNIEIPESLEYEEVFDELLSKYTSKYELRSVKLVNMGSMYKLTYLVNLKNDISEKKFLDEIRVKNGNLKIELSHPIIEGEL